MKTLLIGVLMAAMIVGMFVVPADAWGRHGYRHWGPLGILAAPLVVAGALVAAPFVIAGSVIAAATPPVVVPAPPPPMPPPRPMPAPVMASAPVVASYWYYCQNPRGYYPYVPQCPTGWIQVVPRPQP